MKEISEIVEGLLKRGKASGEVLEPITVRIPKDTSEKLDRLSKELGETKAALMRIFLESAVREAEDHLDKTQGIPKGRKAGSRSAQGRKKDVQGRATTRRKGQEAKGRQKIERVQGLGSEDI